MILVTGGTGLLGSHLLFELVHSGKKVKALKRKTSDLNNVKKTFSYYSNNAKDLFAYIEWVDGDILDIYSISESLENVSEIYHCAAVVSFNPKDKEEMMRVNVNGTANLVNASLERNIKKICHVSSIAALGRADHSGITDENSLWKNSKSNSCDSISKYAGEKEVWRGIEEGLNAVIVNPSVILGPGDWKKGSSGFFPLVWNGLKFYTDGVNGYIDVRDVAKAMIKLMESNISSERFILSSENLSYKQLFEMIAESIGCKPPKYHAGYLMGEIAWRFEKIRSFILNNQPLLTKETSRTAHQYYNYSNQKIKQSLDIDFLPVSKSVQEIGNLFLKDYSVSKIK